MFNVCPHCNKEIDMPDPYRAPARKSEPKEKPKKIRWYSKMDWRNFFLNLWSYTVNIFWSLIAISVISFGGYFLYKWITSPNKVDYCYVAGSTTANSWVLMGNVQWGTDRYLGSFSEVYLAQKYAQKINCPLDITLADEVDTAVVTSVPAPTTDLERLVVERDGNKYFAYPAPIRPVPSASTPELLP